MFKLFKVSFLFLVMIVFGCSENNNESIDGKEIVHLSADSNNGDYFYNKYIIPPSEYSPPKYIPPDKDSLDSLAGLDDGFPIFRKRQLDANSDGQIDELFFSETSGELIVFLRENQKLHLSLATNFFSESGLYGIYDVKLDSVNSSVLVLSRRYTQHRDFEALDFVELFADSNWIWKSSIEELKKFKSLANSLPDKVVCVTKTCNLKRNINLSKINTSLDSVKNIDSLCNVRIDTVSIF